MVNHSGEGVIEIRNNKHEIGIARETSQGKPKNLSQFSQTSAHPQR